MRRCPTAQRATARYETRPRPGRTGRSRQERCRTTGAGPRGWPRPRRFSRPPRLPAANASRPPRQSLPPRPPKPESLVPGTAHTRRQCSLRAQRLDEPRRELGRSGRSAPTTRIRRRTDTRVPARAKPRRPGRADRWLRCTAPASTTLQRGLCASSPRRHVTTRQRGQRGPGSRPRPIGPMTAAAAPSRQPTPGASDHRYRKSPALFRAGEVPLPALA